MEGLKKIALIVLSSVVVGQAQAAEIVCSAVDGVGKNVRVEYTHVSVSYGASVGVLKAVTEQGAVVLDTKTYLVGREGKVTDSQIGLGKDLFIESDELHMNLDKQGRQQYTGDVCASRKGVVVGNISFVANDCLQITCRSSGLSTIK